MGQPTPPHPQAASQKDSVPALLVAFWAAEGFRAVGFGMFPPCSNRRASLAETEEARARKVSVYCLSRGGLRVSTD